MYLGFRGFNSRLLNQDSCQTCKNNFVKFKLRACPEIKYWSVYLPKSFELKRITLIFLLAFVWLCSASAQGHVKKHEMEKMQLNAQQKSSLQSLKKETKSKKQSILADKSLSDEQKSEQLRNLKMERKKELQKILTPAQIHQLKKMRKEQMKKNYRSVAEIQRRRLIERNELGIQF
ncbi:MAG: hypothetical protein C5B52_11600 [Bacteroidetes bacterium]|nr:MAG: hypothetical protein C5B52_11600 [Bacteroidota bacterium]